jgi:hypothetical protein
MVGWKKYPILEEEKYWEILNHVVEVINPHTINPHAHVLHKHPKE